MLSRPNAITHLIFDCDGVLVDSEIIAVEVESTLLTQAGFPITPDEIAERYVGLSYASMFSGLADQFDRPVPEDITHTIEQSVRAKFPQELREVKGIGALLAGSDLPRAVASSSDLDRIHQSLALTHLDQYFHHDLVLSAEMVEHGKPAPDLFLLATERLDVSPDRCLVVEDSPHGVIAAKRAGMAVVGLLAGRHARPSLGARLVDAGADAVVASVTELNDYIHAR